MAETDKHIYILQVVFQAGHANILHLYGMKISSWLLESLYLPEDCISWLTSMHEVHSGLCALPTYSRFPSLCDLHALQRLANYSSLELLCPRLYKPDYNRSRAT